MAIAQIRADGLGDFTTLAAWHASLASPLAEDQIAEITGAIDATGPATIFTAVTSPTARLIIRPAPGQETTYKEGDGRARIEFGNFDFVVRSASSQHLTIEKAALGLNGSNASVFIESSGAPASADWLWRDCYIRNIGTNTSLSNNRDFPGWVLENCLLYGMRTSSAASGLVSSNCSFIAGLNPVDLGSTTVEDARVEDCYAAHNSNAFGHFRDLAAGSFGLATANANEGGTVAPGIVNAALLDQYVDPAAGDWTLKPTAALKGAAAGGGDIGFVMPAAGGGGGGESVASGAVSTTAAAITPLLAGHLRTAGNMSAPSPPPVATGGLSQTSNATAALRLRGPFPAIEAGFQPSDVAGIMAIALAIARTDGRIDLRIAGALSAWSPGVLAFIGSGGPKTPPNRRQQPRRSARSTRAAKRSAMRRPASTARTFRPT